MESFHLFICILYGLAFLYILYFLFHQVKQVNPTQDSIIPVEIIYSNPDWPWYSYNGWPYWSSGGGYRTNRNGHSSSHSGHGSNHIGHGANRSGHSGGHSGK